MNSSFLVQNICDNANCKYEPNYTFTRHISKCVFIFDPV